MIRQNAIRIMVMIAILWSSTITQARAQGAGTFTPNNQSSTNFLFRPPAFFVLPPNSQFIPILAQQIPYGQNSPTITPNLQLAFRPISSVAWNSAAYTNVNGMYPGDPGLRVVVISSSGSSGVPNQQISGASPPWYAPLYPALPFLVNPQGVR